MNQTTPTLPPASVPPKRTRRTYDAAFKKSAVECWRYDGDVARTARELGVNLRTHRDWISAQP